MKIVTVHPEHVAVRKQPSNLKSKDLHLFSGEFKRRINPAHVRILKDVHLINGLIIDIKRIKLNKTYVYPPVVSFYSRAYILNQIHFLLKLLKAIFLIAGKSKTVTHAVWITDRRSWEYFHWMTDALPRLIACKEFINPSHTLILPNKYKEYAYITDSLNAFNIPVLFFKQTIKIKIQDLILPSHTALPGNYNKLFINQLRALFLNPYKDLRPYRKIYISREKAPKRKIANEKAVVQILTKYGYEPHCFEDYSLQKQITLCAEAKSIVGLHGAGLTNILFLHEKGQLLEFRNQNDKNNNCYFSLASDLNIDYYYQINKGNKRDTHTVTITVDLDELENNLQLMLQNNACWEND